MFDPSSRSDDVRVVYSAVLVKRKNDIDDFSLPARFTLTVWEDWSNIPTMSDENMKLEAKKMLEDMLGREVPTQEELITKYITEEVLKETARVSQFTLANRLGGKLVDDAGVVVQSLLNTAATLALSCKMDCMEFNDRVDASMFEAVRINKMALDLLKSGFGKNDGPKSDATDQALANLNKLFS